MEIYILLKTAIFVATFIIKIMVKGGADNRSFLRQRRKKRTKIFHSSRKKITVVAECSHDVASENDVTDTDNATVNDVDMTVSFADKSASEKKIETIAIHEEDNLLSGFRLMNMKLFSIMMDNFACPHCLHIGLSIKEVKKYGLAFQFEVFCLHNDCEWKFWSSQQRNVPSKKKGFDVNARLVYAMRRCGKGYRGVRRLLMMNHPPPMSEKNYYKLTSRFSEAVRAVAFKSMTDASNEIHNLQTDGIVDTAVSVDGTWQRRCYSSMNGARLHQYGKVPNVGSS